MESDEQQAAQLEFNWTYLERKAWIEQAELPAGRGSCGTGVSAGVMVRVLHCINDHLGDNPESWPSQQRIAALGKMNVRTVRRATQALTAHSLLIVIPYPRGDGGHRNHYRIVWTELQLLDARRRCVVVQPAPQKHEDVTSGHADVTSGHADVTSGHADVTSGRMRTSRPPNNSLRTTKEHSKEQLTTEPLPLWTVVVSDLKSLGMCAFRQAIAAAQARGLTPIDCQRLIARYRRCVQEHPNATIGWLYRWLVGTSKPPPDDPPSQQRQPSAAQREANRKQAIDGIRWKALRQIRGQVEGVVYAGDPRVEKLARQLMEAAGLGHRTVDTDSKDKHATLRE